MFRRSRFPGQAKAYPPQRGQNNTRECYGQSQSDVSRCGRKIVDEGTHHSKIGKYRYEHNAYTGQRKKKKNDDRSRNRLSICHAQFPDCRAASHASMTATSATTSAQPLIWRPARASAMSAPKASSAALAVLA